MRTACRCAIQEGQEQHLPAAGSPAAQTLTGLPASLAQELALRQTRTFHAAISDALTPYQYASWINFTCGTGISGIWSMVTLLAAHDLAAREGFAAAAAAFPEMAAVFRADATGLGSGSKQGESHPIRFSRFRGRVVFTLALHSR